MACKTQQEDGINPEEDSSDSSVVFLYNTEKISGILKGLRLAAVEPSEETIVASEAESNNQELSLEISEKMFCSSCQAKFTDQDEQRQHYKTDWHRYNLKQKLKGSHFVDEEEFDNIISQRDDDLSSISGSDTESDSEASKMAVVGEEDESESFHVEGIGRRHPKVFFRNSDGKLASIFRCVLHGKKNRAETSADLIRTAEAMPQQMKWAILMTAAGHFAGAIFDKEKILVHKTFHRYVVRAKRGTVQSIRDKQGGTIHSAGASLRRHNEAALTQEIQELISSWSSELKSCDRIFVRTPSYNKNLYFSAKNSPIDKSDSRVRPIPFTNRRPTFRELQRVHGILASVDCYGEGSMITDFIKASPKKSRSKPVETVENISHISAPKVLDKKENEWAVTNDDSGDDFELVEEEVIVMTNDLREFEITKNPRSRRRGKKKKTEKAKEDNGAGDNTQPAVIFDGEEKLQRNAVYTACKTGDIAALEETLAVLSSCQKEADNQETSGKESDAFAAGFIDVAKVLNSPFGQKGCLLHIAAAAGFKDLIIPLLQAGVQPTTVNSNGQTPYMVSSDKATRNEFRKFMALAPSMYDYTAAKIPSPMTEDMIAEKKLKEAEKRKAQRKIRKEKDKEKRAAETAQKNEERQRERFLALSDREKRALAAERRLLTQYDNSDVASKPILSHAFTALKT